jgi:membrane protein
MYLVRLFERMEDNHIFLSAAALSFNAFLCFIPLLLLVFYLLALYFEPTAAVNTLDRYLEQLDLFPYQREQIAEAVTTLLNDFISGSSLAGALGAVGLVWAAQALFAALRTVLNTVFHARDTHNILVSKLKDFALLSIVGILVITIGVFMYGQALLSGLGEQVFGLTFDSWLLGDITSTLTPFVLTLVAFVLIFSLVPDRRLPWRVVLISSVIASLLWGIARLVLTYYLEHLWKLGSIYGPYAILVATALWVYYSSITVLFAAEIGEMFNERSRLKRLFNADSLERVIGFAPPPDLLLTHDHDDGDEGGSSPT